MVANLIRALIAALDNAEAPPAPAGQVHYHFGNRPTEIERLLLSASDVRHVLLVEIEQHERAAAEMERLGKLDRAEALRAGALLAKRYLE